MTRLIGLLLLAVLSGCATRAPEPKPDAAAAAATAVPAEGPAVYSLDIRVDDSALRSLLQENLDLARYRASQAALSRVELARLAAAAPAQAEALLETEGYFNAKVDVSRDPDDDTRLLLTVTPGPRTRVGEAKIEFTEGLADDDARALRESLRNSWAPAGRRLHAIAMGLGQE